MSKEGPCLISMLAYDGTRLTLNANNEQPRLWLRVDQSGEPSIVFFDKEGKSPVERARYTRR